MNVNLNDLIHAIKFVIVVCGFTIITYIISTITDIIKITKDIKKRSEEIKSIKKYRKTLSELNILPVNENDLQKIFINTLVEYKILEKIDEGKYKKVGDMNE